MSYIEFRAHTQRLRSRGMIVRRLLETGEYYVNFAGGSEDTAYYATDAEDAIATADEMLTSAAELSMRLRFRSAFPAFDARD